MCSTWQISTTPSHSVPSPNRIRHQYVRVGQKLMRICIDVAKRVLPGSLRWKAHHTQTNIIHRMLIKFTDAGVMKSTPILLFADGKAKLPLCMALRRMGGGGSEGIFPLILNVRTRWGKWSVTHLDRFRHGVISSGAHCTGGRVGTKACLHAVRKKQPPCPCETSKHCTLEV